MALAHALILGIGGLLVGVPVILHMLMQPKPKTYQFPALRFVKQMHQSNRRSLQLRHWILLLMRCLLLLAVAAAFARPSTPSAAFGNWLGLGAGVLLSLLTGLLFLYAVLWSRPPNIPMALVVGAVLALLLAYTGYTARSTIDQNATHVLSDQQAPVATVLLVDNSPRLSYRQDNQTLLEKVQDHGRWLIGQLPLNSRVAVVETDGEYPFFSVDISAARKRLNTLDINFASNPVPESLEQAIKFLAKTEYERKEVYVFTDLTRVGWISSGDSLKRLLEENPEVSLFVIDVGVEDPQNFSLDELRLTASSIPARGQLEITTNVRAIGPGASLLVKLMLEKPDLSKPSRQDGKTLVPEEHWSRPANVTVANDSMVSTKIILQDDLQEGIHHGWMEIEGSDSLAADDRRYFTIEVRPSWPVLVASPDGTVPDNLTFALDTGMFDVKSISQRDLAGEPLSSYSAVFLMDPEPLTDPLWRILQDYVESGGGLALFLGHNAMTDRQPDIAFRTDSAAAVLPGRLARDWIRKKQDRFLSLDNTTHPILRPFRSRESLDIWHSFPVYRHWELEYGTDPDVEVIARYTNGVGAILQRNLGGGKVICMTTPVTEPARPDGRESWNDLFNSSRGKRVWPSWLLISEISEFLASGTRDRINLGVGQSATIHNDVNLMPSEYRLFTPRDEDPVRVASADNLLRYKFTDTPGSYRLKGQRDADAKPVVLGFSVNMPPESTDLIRVDESALTETLGEGRFQLARDRKEIVRQQGTTRLGQEFYPVLALAMSLLLALELIMSNRFYKK